MLCYPISKSRRAARCARSRKSPRLPGWDADDLELYGKYKAKLSTDVWTKLEGHENGKLVLVTAINPTPAGEGKTTTTVGLGQSAWPGLARMR